MKGSRLGDWTKRLWWVLFYLQTISSLLSLTFFCLRRSRTGSQNSFCLGDPPKGKSKYSEGQTLKAQPNIFAKWEQADSEIEMANIWVLFQLTLRPETNSKYRIKDLWIRIFLCSGFIRRRFSSANWRCETLTFSGPSWKPSKMLRVSALEMIWLRESASKVKRKDDKGSSCHRPLVAGKRPLGLPFRRTE